MTSYAPRPPTPPRLDHWPIAVRSAELIRGTVVHCGPGLRLVSWPETPSVRTVALRPWHNEQRAAAHLTAAWVWGAARRPGDPLEFLIRSGRAYDRVHDGSVRLRKYRIRDDEIVELGGLAVTTPLRTLFDMLRDERFSAEHRLACRVLLAHSPELAANLDEGLVTRWRASPYRRRIRARLEELAQPRRQLVVR